MRRRPSTMLFATRRQRVAHAVGSTTFRVMGAAAIAAIAAGGLWWQWPAVQAAITPRPAPAPTAPALSPIRIPDAQLQAVEEARTRLATLIGRAIGLAEAKTAAGVAPALIQPVRDAAAQAQALLDADPLTTRQLDAAAAALEAAIAALSPILPPVPAVDEPPAQEPPGPQPADPQPNPGDGGGGAGGSIATSTQGLDCPGPSNTFVAQASGGGTVTVTISGPASGYGEGAGTATATATGGPGTYTATATGDGSVAVSVSC